MAGDWYTHCLQFPSLTVMFWRDLLRQMYCMLITLLWRPPTPPHTQNLISNRQYLLNVTILWESQNVIQTWRNCFEFQDIILSMVSAVASVIRKTQKRICTMERQWIHSDGKIASINKNSTEPLNISNCRASREGQANHFKEGYKAISQTKHSTLLNGGTSLYRSTWISRSDCFVKQPHCIEEGHCFQWKCGSIRH